MRRGRDAVPEQREFAPRAERTLCAEDVEDADLDGDRPFSPGTARAALSYRAFRRVYAGSVASNMGTWMQSVVLTAYAYELTGSKEFVGLMNFATLGPLLVLSLLGGSMADRFNRRKLLIITSFEQAFFAICLAVVALDPHPAPALLLVTVFVMNCGSAIAAPAFSAVLPELVDRRDMAGAVSLTSANMNISRVVGAALGPFVYATWGVSWVFAVNAVTYFFIVAGLAGVEVPVVAPRTGNSGMKRIVEGFAVVKRDAILTRVMVTCAVFSFFSLAFIAMLPIIARENLGLDPKSMSYGLLYGSFGLGAAAGALSLGTFLAGRDLARLVQVGFLTFAGALSVLALLRAPGPAYPTAFAVGFCYFMAFTSLSTVLQHRVEDQDRGKVMAIWIMAFGGMVSINVLVLSHVAEATSTTVVILLGAVVAVALAFYARLRDPAEAAADERTLAAA